MLGYHPDISDAVPVGKFFRLIVSLLPQNNRRGQSMVEKTDTVNTRSYEVTPGSSHQVKHHISSTSSTFLDVKCFTLHNTINVSSSN